MSLKVVLLGSNGFTEARLSLTLSKQSQFHISPTETLPLDKIVLFDVGEAQNVRFKRDIAADPRCQFIRGDLCDKDTMLKVLDPEDKYTRVTVIHLAAVLSGYSEACFDLGMKVNLYGTLNVMECLRETTRKHSILGGVPQIYFFSSPSATTTPIVPFQALRSPSG